jgi:hypothetical protein
MIDATESGSEGAFTEELNDLITVAYVVTYYDLVVSLLIVIAIVMDKFAFVIVLLLVLLTATAFGLLQF